MPELVASAYEDESLADRTGEEPCRGREELLIDPDASSVLICERDEGCRLTTSHRAHTTAHWSEFWGALLDALLDGSGPPPIEDRHRIRLLALLRPGTSILLLVAPSGGAARTVDALSHFEGRALCHRLADDLPGPWNAGSRDLGVS
jgi:hypothetical protein